MRQRIVVPPSALPPRLFTIDPGSTESHFAEFDLFTYRLVSFGTLENFEMLKRIETLSECLVVIEQIASYGMEIGEETIETVFVSGRMFDRAVTRGHLVRAARIKRKEVAVILCLNTTAGDSNIRRAVMDRFGGDSSIKSPKRCTRKKHETCGCNGTGIITPAGALFGVTGDRWQALGAAIAYAEDRLGVEGPVKRPEGAEMASDIVE